MFSFIDLIVGLSVSAYLRMSSRQLDPAIVEALNLENADARIANHGGSGFSSTFKVTATVDGEERLYFVKTGQGKDAKIMFTGEHASLNAINSVVPSLCPISYAHGPLSRSGGHFLATDFLNLRSSSSAPSSGLSLATKLATLHSTPAPIPDGYTAPQFGFPVPTCCGSTEQENTYTSSWADFYANHRLRTILRASEKSNGSDPELRKLIEQTADRVVPRLLGDDHLNGGRGVTPVIVHGDLWSGNHGRGSIGKGGVEEVVFDASSCYAHSEFDLGIMKMFGGFGSSFYKEYHKQKPKDEPVEEYEDRVELYHLYHCLNHHAMFGGGYRSSAVGIMKSLIRKFG